MNEFVGVPENFTRVWPTVGHPGRVPLDALVPDPKQPRKYIDPDELKDLAHTMDPKNGGEQREILTVRTFSDEELIARGLTTEDHRYWIVSGERRWQAAHLVGLPDIEIRVKAYRERRAQKLDAHMLNNGRVGLSDIENALSIADLAKDYGWETQAEIASNIGESQVWVSQRLALLKLSPTVQEMMSPKLKLHLRLKLGTAVELAKLDHGTQDDYVAHMPKGARVTASQQIRWIQERNNKTGVVLQTRVRKPGTVRRILHAFAGFVDERAGKILNDSNLGHVFENVKPGEVETIMAELHESQAKISRLITELEATLDPDGKTATPEAETPVSTAAPAPVEPQRSDTAKEPELRVDRPLEPAAPKANGAMSDRSPRVMSGDGSNGARGSFARPSAAEVELMRVARAVESGPRKTIGFASNKERTVQVFDDGLGRIVMKAVTRNQYVEFLDNGKLDFQIRGTERPEYLPSREQALDLTREF